MKSSLGHPTLRTCSSVPNNESVNSFDSFDRIWEWVDDAEHEGNQGKQVAKAHKENDWDIAAVSNQRIPRVLFS